MQAEGIVTIAQEERFQLCDQHGVSHLFILSYRAAAEPEQLQALQHRQARVRVTYKPARNLIGLVAQSIDLVSPSDAPDDLSDEVRP